MAVKSRFVGVRMDQDLVHKLIMLSAAAGEPGNVSAAVRWAVEVATAAKKLADLDNQLLQDSDHE